MANFFGAGGLQIDPGLMSTIQNDYWEEFSKVNEAFVHEPEIIVRKSTNNIKDSKGNKEKLVDNESSRETPELSFRKQSKVYPQKNDEKISGENNGIVLENGFIVYRSIAIQTDGNYDEEPELPYKCCFCFRSSTPFVVWIFVGISIIFFKMGAIVTGRWIYLSSSSFDEVTFYIAFTICLGFGTIYFRRGTKYHNPYDLFFLLLTIPIMWALLTFTTTFLKKDMFFYVASGIYSAFIFPYILMGIYITYRFWKGGKLFLRRVENNLELEPFCRKIFFAQSLMLFDVQTTICSCVISMAPSVNESNTVVWISSLIVAPICIGIAILSLIIGYLAIRKENMLLTRTFTILGANQFILVGCMLLRRPKDIGVYSLFINSALLFSASALLVVHVLLLVVLWKFVVPAYGRGVKGAVNRTSRNNCIQCAQLTICH